MVRERELSKNLATYVVLEVCKVILVMGLLLANAHENYVHICIFALYSIV